MSAVLNAGGVSPKADFLRVALLGNPNCGKTALFNLLTGGAWGGDPLAVRVGRATFALRQQEAAMVQVQMLA